MSAVVLVSRRSFLELTGLAAGALVFGVRPGSAAAATVERRLGLFVSLDASGTVRIEGGRVVGSSAQDVEVWGYLEDNGDISTRFTAGQTRARANGKLTGAAGSGSWSSNTDYCGGTWKARRVD